MALDQDPGCDIGCKQPDDGATRLPNPGRLNTEIAMIMSSAEHVYTIADNHAQTVQVCIDRLHQLGANEQLKVLIEVAKFGGPGGAGRPDKGSLGPRARTGTS